MTIRKKGFLDDARNDKEEEYTDFVRRYWTYLMASETGILYLGVTNNLERRVYEHKNGIYPGFSKKYGCHKLVYFEEYNDIDQAIAREKQVKNWNRRKKVDLIRKMNPGWEDLTEKWR